MARKTDKSTTKFTKMGTSAASTVDNLSAAPSKNTKRVPKKTTVSAAPQPATVSIRQHVYERNGASYAPKATLYAQNAAEASATQRNTVVVPSALGNRDFYLRRRYGQGV